MSSRVNCNNCFTILVEDYSTPPSPIPHLLCTNRSPSSSELIDICHVLTQIEPYSTRLDAEIERVQAVLDGLLEKRQQVRQFVAEHEPFLTTRRQLPVEIWSEIFLHTLPERTAVDCDQLESGDRFSVNHSPVLLGHVCSSWRMLAISMPDLWTDLCVSISHEGSESQAEWVRLWLQRSRNRPIFLRAFKSARSSGGRNFLTGEDMDWANHPTIKALVASSSRWSEAHFFLPSKAQCNEALRAIRGNLTSLRKLKISLTAGNSLLGDYYVDSTPLDIFSKAPSLHDAELGRFDAFATLQLPYDQLTRFTASPYSGGDALSILRQCPNLEELTCTRCPSPLQNSSTIEHPQLRVLHLQPACSDPLPESLGKILDLMTLPALHHLSARHWKQWPQAQFLRFLARSSREIECLSLHDVSISAEALVICLSEMSSLSKLRLLHVPGAHSLLSRMTEILQLIPELKHIDLMTKDVSDGRHLVGFIRSRWEPRSWISPREQPSNLRSAYLFIQPSRVDEQVDRLQTELERLKVDGFDVSWKVSQPR